MACPYVTSLSRGRHPVAVVRTLAAIRLPDGDRLDLDEQIRAAKNRLDPRGGGQGIQPLLMEKLAANPVELRVVALDITQIAGGAHDVLPSRAFGLEQTGDVAIGPPGLRPEIARMYGAAFFIHAGRPGDQKDGDAFDVQPQPARERRAVRGRLVENLLIANSLFGDWLV